MTRVPQKENCDAALAPCFPVPARGRGVSVLRGGRDRADGSRHPHRHGARQLGRGGARRHGESRSRRDQLRAHGHDVGRRHLHHSAAPGRRLRRRRHRERLPDDDAREHRAHRRRHRCAWTARWPSAGCRTRSPCRPTRSQIQTDSVKVTTAISSKFIQDLPLVVGGQLRSPLDLSLIAPEAKAGTSGDGARGNIVIGGGQEGGWDLTVDGVSATPGAPFEQRLWTTLNSPSVEAITEFAVDTNGFKAEFGHAGGGAVSFVSRSGTNQWRGKAFEFYARRRARLRTTYFSKALGRPKPQVSQHDFGGVFGGPVTIPKLYNGRDRTFFFASYEALSQQDRGRAVDRHHPDGRDVQRRFLELARRERQSHPDLRPGDDAAPIRTVPGSSATRSRTTRSRSRASAASRREVIEAGDDAARPAGRAQQLRLHAGRPDQHEPVEQVQHQARSQPVEQGSARLPVPLGRSAGGSAERTGPAAGCRFRSTTSATRIRTPTSTGPTGIA